MEFTADSAASLQELRSRRAGSRTKRIRLAGPLEDERAERALNRAYFACGCVQGSIAAMAVLISSLSSGVLLGFDGAVAWWRIPLYLAAAALIGKVTGLAITRLRLRRIYRQLQARVDLMQADRNRRPGERPDVAHTQYLWRIGVTRGFANEFDPTFLVRGHRHP